MNIKVLVVEDNMALNKSIISLLKKEGFTGISAFRAASAKQLFLAQQPHIVLLDVMLPDENGLSLIPVFRKNSETRIIIITAINETDSKIMAYKQGADDYIIKPFDLYELVLKLNAQKRHIIAAMKERRVGDISFNTETGELTCDGRRFFMQPSQTKLLKLLYDRYNNNIYLNKDEALDWQSHDVDESIRLHTLVARLRKSLADIGSRQVCIETIYGKGYRLMVGKFADE